MARPQKEGLDYFPHDTDSSSDEKIEALMMLYGPKGYTFYFVLLERIYRTSNFELDISDTETIQILSRKMSVTTEEFTQMLKSAIKHKCFDSEKYQAEQVLTSNGIKKRAGVVIEKREKMRIAYENKKQNISDAETGEETTPETPQSKVKERKENIYVDFFEQIWKLYPIKKGKASISNNQIKKLYAIGLEEITRAIDRYKKEIETKQTEKQFIKHGSTFFNTGYVDYLDANYQPEETDKPKSSTKEVVIPDWYKEE